MRRVRSWQSAALAAVAAAGLLAGHALGYLVAVPDAAHRADLLHRTGHAYLPTVVPAAVVAAVVGLLAALALGYRGSRTGRGDALRWPLVTVRLSALQVAGFVALELLERAAWGAATPGLTARLLVLGSALQVLTAGVAALVFVLLVRAGEAMGGSPAPAFPAAPPPFVPLPAFAGELRPGAVAGPRATRGPPTPR